MPYKQLTEAYKEVTCTYRKLINRASLEIYRHGDLVDDTLQEKRALETKLKDTEWIHEVLKDSICDSLGEKESMLTEAEKEVKELRERLFKSEVARERAEGELKKTVEQRDKWERLGKKAKEKEGLEKDLRQQLREAKLTAKRAPTITAATQTHQAPVPQRNSACQTEKPTYASMATQADSGKREKGKGKAAEPAPTTVALTSATEDIEMRDWSPYEDLSVYEKEVEVVHTRAVRKRPAAMFQPATPPAATKQPTTSHRAYVVYGIGCQQPMAVIIPDARKWGNVLGARWLLDKSRREGKATSSVVVFYNGAVHMGPTVKIRGKKHLVATYD